MSEVKIMKLPEGDSGLDKRVVQGSEKEDEFVALVLSGVRDPVKIAARLKMNLRAVQLALRDNILIGKIKTAVQARAVTMIPDTLEGAFGDTKNKRAQVRSAAREYIRKIAEGDEKVVQQNNQITTWDPSYDERLFEKGREMFRAMAEVVVEETVSRLEDDDR